MHLRALVFLTLILPGIACRSYRVGDSQDNAQWQTKPFTTSLEGTQLGSIISTSEANDKVTELNAMVDDAKESKRRINRKITSLTAQKADTQSELDMTFFLNIRKKRKLKRAIRGLKKEIAVERHHAKKAVEYSLTVESHRNKVVANAQAEEREHPLQHVKKLGVAGVASYALWGSFFWTVHPSARSSAIYMAFGFWPGVEFGRKRAEAFAFVKLARFVIPLRIGLAVGIAPWLSRGRVVQRFNLSNNGDDIDWDSSFAEDFQVVDEAAVLVKSLHDIKAMLKLLTDASLNTGSGIVPERVDEESDSDEPMIISKWSFEMQESDLSDTKVIEELNKSFEFPLHVAGSSTFKVNKDGMIQQMKVGSWSINNQVIPVSR